MYFCDKIKYANKHNVVYCVANIFTCQFVSAELSNLKEINAYRSFLTSLHGTMT